MARAKRYLSIAMALVCVIGFFAFSPSVAYASELVTTSYTLPTSAYAMLAWEQTGSDFQKWVYPGSNGYLVFDHLEASSTWRFAMQLELRNYQFALNDEYGGLKAKSVKITMKFRVLRDTNLWLNRSGVFADLGSVALYVPGNPATLTDSMYTYVVTNVDADSYDCELTVFADNLPEESFDYHNLSLFFSGESMLYPYQSDPVSSPNVYDASIIVQPLFGSVDFTYYRTSADDKLSSDLLTPSTDVDSDISDKDATIDEFNSDIDGIMDGIIDDNPDVKDPFSIFSLSDWYAILDDTFVKRIWTVLNEYPALEAFISLGLVFCLCTFILRR